MLQAAIEPKFREYHNFLQYFKNNPYYEVVAFTATQIPGIEEKDYPAKLAGKLYPKGIRIHRESELPWLIKKYKVDYVYLCYSDLPNQYVMEKASLVLANGTNFALLGTKDTMIPSSKPVISVCAVRTGSGKSQTSRAIGEILRKNNKKVVAIRHAMPYGNLIKQEVQRFSKFSDIIENKCTIEEREEYEPWIKRNIVVYAGVDYEKILRKAEKESNVIIWDGGNNDFSFIRPDLQIVVTDPHRAGHEITYYPGFVNLLMADIIIVNKIDSAKKQDIKIVLNNIKKYNPKADIILAKSILTASNPGLIKNKLCLAIGDGPTLSHGGMKFGAATLAIKKYGGKIANPKPHVVGSIKETYKNYPHLGEELPAMGYSKKQIKELEETINRTKCDVIVDGSPVTLSSLIKTKKPIVEIDYEMDKDSIKKLENILRKKRFI